MVGGRSSVYILRELSTCVCGEWHDDDSEQSNLTTVTLQFRGYHELSDPLGVLDPHAAWSSLLNVASNTLAVLIPTDKTDQLLIRLPLRSVFGQPFFLQVDLSWRYFPTFFKYSESP